MMLAPLKQKLNYDEVVTGRDLDFETYSAKIEMWRWVEEHKVLEGPTVEAARAGVLLDDLTIYALALLKNDDGEPFLFTAYQDAIAGCVHDFKSGGLNQYILFKASNQIGKSAFLIIKAIKIATTETNRNIVIISKSLPQSQFLLSQLKLLLTNSKFGGAWREDIGETENTTQITITLQEGGRTKVNRIICAPAGEGSLGYPIHYLFLDELDFYENAKILFWKVFFPRVKKTKGQIIVFSNPNAEISKANSILHELWIGDLFQRKFSFKFLDAPWNTVEEYERDKRNSPHYIFTSTHDGEFPDEGSSFFSAIEIQDMLQHDWKNELPVTDKPVFVGVDLGKMRDPTEIAVGIVKEPVFKEDRLKDLDVRYVEHVPIGTDYTAIAKRIRDIRDYYAASGISVTSGFDATGQKTFGDLLKSMGISAIPVDYSEKKSNKTLLFNDFKLMVENRKIKVVYDRQTENQLAGLNFKYTEGKKLRTVEAKTEATHDDIPNAIAILIHVSVRPSRVPVTVTFIKTGGDVKEVEGVVQQDSEALAAKQAIEQTRLRMRGFGSTSGPY